MDKYAQAGLVVRELIEKKNAEKSKNKILKAMKKQQNKLVKKRKI